MKLDPANPHREERVTSLDLDSILEHREFMRRLAFKLLRNRDPDRADELVQETTVRFWRTPPEHREEPALRAWIRTVMTRIVGRSLERDKAYGGKRERLAREYADRHHLEADSASDLAARLEKQRLIVERVLALPPRERDAIVGRYLDETPWGELSKRLGVSEHSLKKRATAGMNRLRQELHADDPELRSVWVPALLPFLPESELADFLREDAMASAGKLGSSSVATGEGAKVVGIVAAAVVGVGALVGIILDQTGEEVEATGQRAAAPLEAFPSESGPVLAAMEGTSGPPPGPAPSAGGAGGLAKAAPPGGGSGASSQESWSLEGRLFDPGEHVWDLPDVELELQLPDGSAVQTQTDHIGAFRFEGVPAPTGTLVVTDPRFTGSAEWLEGTNNLNLTIEAVEKVVVALKDPSGADLRDELEAAQARGELSEDFRPESVTVLATPGASPPAEIDLNGQNPRTFSRDNEHSRYVGSGSSVGTVHLTAVTWPLTLSALVGDVVVGHRVLQAPPVGEIDVSVSIQDLKAQLVSLDFELFDKVVQQPLSGSPEVELIYTSDRSEKRRDSLGRNSSGWHLRDVIAAPGELRIVSEGYQVKRIPIDPSPGQAIDLGRLDVVSTTSFGLSLTTAAGAVTDGFVEIVIGDDPRRSELFEVADAGQTVIERVDPEKSCSIFYCPSNDPNDVINDGPPAWRMLAKRYPTAPLGVQVVSIPENHHTLTLNIDLDDEELGRLTLWSTAGALIDERDLVGSDKAGSSVDLELFEGTYTVRWEPQGGEPVETQLSLVQDGELDVPLDS